MIFVVVNGLPTHTYPMWASQRIFRLGFEDTPFGRHRIAVGGWPSQVWRRQVWRPEQASQHLARGEVRWHVTLRAPAVCA